VALLLLALAKLRETQASLQPLIFAIVRQQISYFEPAYGFFAFIFSFAGGRAFSSFQ
jgi:hypothetical protein